MANNLHSTYRLGIRWSLAGSLGAALFQFAQMAVFARMARPEAAGDYALAATFISFLTPVAEAGLSQAVVQAERIHPRQLAALAWVNWGLGAFIFIVLWLAGPTLAGWFGRSDLPGLLLLMGASLLVTPFGAQYSGLMSREMRFDQSAKIEVVSWAVSFVGTVWLAWQGWGAWAMAVGFLLRNMVGTFGCVWAGSQIIAINLFKTSSLREVAPMLRFGFFELSSRWADFFSNYLDKLIVAKWLGVAALGYYNLAFTFLMLPTARLGYVVTRVAFPVFAKVRHDRLQLQSFFERSAREVILLLFPIYLAMALFSKEIVLLFFGENWLPAAPLFVALGLAGLVRTLCAPFPQLVKGLGRPQLWLVWMLVFSSVLCGSLLLFLSLNSTIESAAWSRTAAKFVIEIGLLWWLARRCGVGFSPVLRFGARVAVWLLPIVALTWLAGFAPGGFWVATVLKSTVFGAGLLWLYGRGHLRKEAQALLQNFTDKAA